MFMVSCAHVLFFRDKNKGLRVVLDLIFFFSSAGSGRIPFSFLFCLPPSD